MAASVTTHNPDINVLVKYGRAATLALAGLLSLAFVSTATADSDSAVQKITTANGHTYWYHPMPNADRTALAVSWAQQVPLDEAIHPAVARLGIEVMLNGGAGDRDAAQIVADYQDLDSGSGLWVQPQHVSGFIVAPDKHFSKAREIARQVLTEPTFAQRWFDREQDKLVENELEEDSNSWGMAWNVSRSVLFGDHPYNRFWSLGPTEALKSITLDNIKQWHQTSFSSKTATVAVAGSASADVISSEIDALFEGMPSNPPAPFIELPAPVLPSKTILLHHPDAPKSVLVILGSLPAHDQTKDLPVQLAVGVLGYGKQSRLFKSVRAGLGASYGFGAGLFNFTRQHRMLEMSGEIETAQLQTALKEIEQTYNKFRDSGIGRLEFPVATQILKRETRKQLQNPVNMAFTVSEAVQNNFPTDYATTLAGNISSMKRDSVNKIIKDAFPTFDKLMKVIVSPDAKAVEGACVIKKIEEAADCL